MKIFFLLLTFSSMAHAEKKYDFSKALDSLKNGPKLDCEENNGSVKHRLTSAYRAKGANCSKFITDSGELGAHGKVIVNHINKISGTRFFENQIGAIAAACPKWTKLSKAEKEHFWVWFFAALAFKESTCKEGQINRNATHGSAVGYFQLNERVKDRRWRDGPSGSSCGALEVKSSIPNIKCSMEIFNEQLKGQDGIYKGNGDIVGRGAHSYWQDLRQSSNHSVIRMVKDFPPCK